jgi:CheY-like chemotaxis protein
LGKVLLLAEANPQSAAGSEQQRSFILSATVLLVDDSKLLRAVNGRALAKAGYIVLTAEDGEEGLRVAREKIPDLVLLDMILPKLGGVEVLHRLKQDPLTSQIPVIVLSSMAQKNEERLMSEGAAGYFEKSKLNLETGSSALVEAVSLALSRPI